MCKSTSTEAETTKKQRRRYFLCRGVALGDDFVRQLKRNIDLSGMTVVRLTEPVSCFVFCAGRGIGTLNINPENVLGVNCGVIHNQCPKEKRRMSFFQMQVNPKCDYFTPQNFYVIDVTDSEKACIIRSPSSEEYDRMFRSSSPERDPEEQASSARKTRNRICKRMNRGIKRGLQNKRHR